MTNPELLLMDEPTEGLAPLLVREVGRVIESLKREGLSILLVEQNLPAGALASPTTSTSCPAGGSCTRARRTRSGATRRSSRGISDCEDHAMKRIAIVGVGLLGSAVASRLLEGGFAVVGYDSRPDQLNPARAARPPGRGQREGRGDRRRRDLHHPAHPRLGGGRGPLGPAACWR